MSQEKPYGAFRCYFNTTFISLCVYVCVRVFLPLHCLVTHVTEANDLLKEQSLVLYNWVREGLAKASFISLNLILFPSDPLPPGTLLQTLQAHSLSWNLNEFLQLLNPQCTFTAPCSARTVPCLENPSSPFQSNKSYSSCKTQCQCYLSRDTSLSWLLL